MEVIVIVVAVVIVVVVVAVVVFVVMLVVAAATVVVAAVVVAVAPEFAVAVRGGVLATYIVLTVHAFVVFCYCCQRTKHAHSACAYEHIVLCGQNTT